MKNKAFLNAKSFKYIYAVSDDQAYDTPQTFRNNTHQKIQLLRAPVYHKKNKQKLITNSRKYMKDPKVMKQLPINSEYQRKQLTERPQTQHYRYKKRGKTHDEIITGRKSVSGHFKDQKQFGQVKIITLVTSQRKLDRNFTQNYSNTKRLSYQKDGQSKLFTRNNDSQSLIRKSSLFLSNFMKRKQKSSDNKQSPHIAGIENATTIVKFHKTVKKPSTTYRKFQNKNTPDPKIKRNLSKILNSMPIDPW